MNAVTGPTGKTLMEELRHEAEGLLQALQAAEDAYIRFEVATQKFAAVRDLVARHLGHVATLNDFQDYRQSGHLYCQFRYANMAPGDAVVSVLREESEPQSLEDILRYLMFGGFDLPSSMQHPQWEQRIRSIRRVANAALLKTSGVERTEDGKYRYVESEGKEELPPE